MGLFTIDRARLRHADADARQQLRASQALLGLAVYGVFAIVQHVEVMLGLIEPADSWALTAYNMTGGLFFYAVIRSGLNLRLRSDRALAMPQTLWAMGSLAWSYAITGPARGAVLLITMLVILFGMFSLPPARSRALTAAGFTMLAAVMVWKAASDPARYDPRVEALHLVFAGIVMAACAMLSMRFGRMRARLEQQRAELAGALDRIRALATRDELTGLLNRRAVMDHLLVALRERHSVQSRLAVALVDLDHFKRINDRHGHAAGDAVLRRFAEAAGAEVRTGDVVARWGGEEFLVMMPGASVEQALAVLARVRARLAATAWDDIAGGLVVTFSAGVALCESELDLEPAIERADAAMYRAKEAGRDRAFGPRALRPAECDTLTGLTA